MKANTQHLYYNKVLKKKCDSKLIFQIKHENQSKNYNISRHLKSKQTKKSNSCIKWKVKTSKPSQVT